MSASESEILFDELNLAANDGQTDTEYSFVLSETDSDIGETQTDGKVQRSSTPINKDILPVKNVLVTFDFPEKKVDHIDVMKIVNFDLIIGKKMENLAWTKQTLVERMDCMLTSGFGSDVKFVFTDQNGKPSGEEEVKAHKCILMSGTQHFSNGTHFAHQAGQCQVEVPTTLGFGRDAIFTMLKYIYTDALPSNGANAISEFTAANYYGVPVLEDYCFGMLKNSMKLENVFFILNVSMRSAGKQEEILQFIDSNAEEIICTGEFFKIGTDVLEILLQRNLKADEFQIYRAVKQWAEEQCRKDGVDNPTGEELRAKLLGPKDLLHLIRFPLIDAKTLASEIRESDILNANELMNILCWKYTKEDAIVSPFLTQTRYQQ